MRFLCHSLLETVGGEGAGVGSLKVDVHGQGGGKILDLDEQGWRLLKIRQFSCTSYVYSPLPGR